MLLEPTKAEHFLSIYKELLAKVSGRTLNQREDYVEARELFVSSGHEAALPTEDSALLMALRTAVYGDFVVGRHRKAFTELVGPNNQVYRVKGITTELSVLLEPWTVVRTGVMQFGEDWICDGLIVPRGIHLGSNMRRDLRERIDASAAKPKKTAPRATEGRFTPLQGQYLAFIYYFTKVNGIPPSEAEMQRYFAVSAPTVHQMVVNLAKLQLIEKVPGQARSIRVRLPREQLPDLE